MRNRIKGNRAAEESFCVNLVCNWCEVTLVSAHNSHWVNDGDYWKPPVVQESPGQMSQQRHALMAVNAAAACVRVNLNTRRLEHAT